MLFKHILVPYDGSPSSDKALAQAIAFARADSAAKLSVAHILNLQPVMLADMTIALPESYLQEIQEQGNRIIDKVKATLGDLPNADVVMLSGSPAAAILDYSESEGCDLIVMGSRGLGSLRELMLGSVSHNVVQHAHIPVLVMK